MNVKRIQRRTAIGCCLGGLVVVVTSQAATSPIRVRAADPNPVVLAAGFTPDPTVVAGVGGGDWSAAQVIERRQTATGLCLGYISLEPHEEVTLTDYFSNLEMRVESPLDTTLIIQGPGGVWCNDDSQGKDPMIAGEWLPGSYRVWIGAYRWADVPEYRLLIHDRL